MVELLFQLEEYEEVLHLDIAHLPGLKRIHAAFYDQSDRFNLIIECEDNSIITEKLTIEDENLSLNPKYLDREFDEGEDPVMRVLFDYE